MCAPSIRTVVKTRRNDRFLRAWSLIAKSVLVFSPEFLYRKMSLIRFSGAPFINGECRCSSGIWFGVWSVIFVPRPKWIICCALFSICFPPLMFPYRANWHSGTPADFIWCCLRPTPGQSAPLLRPCTGVMKGGKARLKDLAVSLWVFDAKRIQNIAITMDSIISAAVCFEMFLWNKMLIYLLRLLFIIHLLP